jgi:Tfp pilus assembly protein FimT
MRQILPATSNADVHRRSQVGTTLIELTVVLVILLIIAAAVGPRVVAMLQSQDAKQLKAKIARLPAEAEAQAVTLQAPVRIRVSSNSIIMEQATLGTDGAITQDTASEQIKQVDLGDGLRLDNAQLNGMPSPPDSWEWVVYPDGSSDAGALEFEEDKSHFSLVITDHAASQWIEGDMPDQTQDIWPAGSLAQRT